MIWESCRDQTIHSPKIRFRRISPGDTLCKLALVRSCQSCHPLNSLPICKGFQLKCGLNCSDTWSRSWIIARPLTCHIFQSNSISRATMILFPEPGVHQKRQPFKFSCARTFCACLYPAACHKESVGGGDKFLSLVLAEYFSCNNSNSLLQLFFSNSLILDLKSFSKRFLIIFDVRIFRQFWRFEFESPFEIRIPAYWLQHLQAGMMHCECWLLHLFELPHRAFLSPQRPQQSARHLAFLHC